MPVHWVIDSRSRLVTVTAEGFVSRTEFEEYLEAVTGSGANPYAKIFDGRASNGGLPAADMLELAARFRALHAEPHGPLAIVVPPEKRERMTPVFGALAAAERPLRFFTSLTAAQRWIRGLAPTHPEKP
jgi:hypothetical protein